MSKFVVAYVPVIHAGYLEFFNRHRGSVLGLIQPNAYNQHEQYQKLGREIRAVGAETMQLMVKATSTFSQVQLFGASELRGLRTGTRVSMPDEDVSRYVAEQYLLPRCRVTFDSIFLRYDLPRTLSQIPPQDSGIEITNFDRSMMILAKETARGSPDWWRQVGGIAVRDGEILFSERNTHMPTVHSVYALGDPRGNFQAGEKTELSCAIHCERGIIALAARNGVKLAGATLYLTTFPCPSCAYSIAVAGFSRVYYTEGYSQLGAAETLKYHGVELIHVSQ